MAVGGQRGGGTHRMRRTHSTNGDAEEESSPGRLNDNKQGFLEGG